MKIDLPDLPPRLHKLAHAIRAEGGRMFLVGGSVRDHLLDRPVKDLDLEVFQLSADRLEAILRRHGRVNAVGRAFGVFKLTIGGQELDISLPRRDSKVGPGHKGIAVQGDPTMTIEEAARRRDLTVNALMADITTGELHDPANGRADLERRILRAVDPDAFLEDPLRTLRVAQFAARLDFAVDPDLVALCARADLHELPEERVQTEWVKLLLRGERPSLGLDFMRRADLTARVFPELSDDPTLGAAVDRAVCAARSLGHPGRRMAIPLVVWLSRTSPEGVVATLDRLKLHRFRGYALRDQVIQVHADLETTPDSDAALRHLATRCELTVWHGAVAALQRHAPATLAHWSERIAALDLATSAPAPWVQGRDLLELGAAPGPAIGTVLHTLYTQQLDGHLRDREHALQTAADLVEASEP